MQRLGPAWGTTSPKSCSSIKALTRPGLEPSSIGIPPVQGWSRSSATEATAKRWPVDQCVRRAGDTMIHTEISPSEVADRTTIRELVDAYAHCAEWRDAEGQRPMFTEDTQFVACMDGQVSHPAQVLEASEALTSVF